MDFNFNIMCIQESCKCEHNDLSQIQLEGYNCLSQGKSVSKG